MKDEEEADCKDNVDFCLLLRVEVKQWLVTEWLLSADGFYQKNDPSWWTDQGPETRLTNQKTQLYKKCENHSNLICIEKSFKIFNQVKHSYHAQL